MKETKWKRDIIFILKVISGYLLFLSVFLSIMYCIGYINGNSKGVEIVTSINQAYDKTAIPSETTIPAESTTPSETTVPGESATPSETTVPGENIIPNEVMMPTESLDQYTETDLEGEIKVMALKTEEFWEEMYISVNIANVYVKPNEESEEVQHLIFTQKVELSSEIEVEGWSKVRVNGIEGYIKSHALMTDEEMLESFQYLFAQILYAEAGGVSKEEMGRVGEVYLNRLTTTYWEFKKVDTFMEVLSQSGQYPDTLRKVKNGIVPSEAALEVSKALLLGDYNNQLPKDCFWQTGFEPNWAVDVVHISDCGNGYYHYYSVPSR